MIRVMRLVSMVGRKMVQVSMCCVLSVFMDGVGCLFVLCALGFALCELL